MARFIDIAYGSLLEAVTNLEIAKKQQFITPEKCIDAYDKAVNLAKNAQRFAKNNKRQKVSV